MTQPMIRATDEVIQAVAKAIGRDRMFRDASIALAVGYGKSIMDIPDVEQRLEKEFNSIWDNNNEDLKFESRSEYEADAINAINAMNLQLLVNPEL
jgi:hypothetical protein